MQAIFQITVNLREVMCYCCGNTGNILPDCHDATSTSKDKWAFKTATQHFCAESQKSESQYGKKSQSTNNMDDSISEFRSWTSGTKNFIQAQILFAHVLSNIVGYLGSK